jgi:hypothetical protein
LNQLGEARASLVELRTCECAHARGRVSQNLKGSSRRRTRYEGQRKNFPKEIRTILQMMQALTLPGQFSNRA